ncbi:MAG TPA: large-conductance mechanosensitive channel protein MscL [Candidatus Kapabacteria bacterium]|nr:large-conductance mechanosensitive channel protein MscL [Candidatus Kapabacteria bacterium]
MSILQEFKEFAVKGNVVDMAVGIIIGGAFGKIVSSFVNDVIMPPIGAMLGGVDFSSLQIIVKDAIGDTPAVAIKYGVFLNTVIDFLIVAFTIFLLVKIMNKLKRKEEEATPAAPAPTPEDILLLREIRDQLKK